MTDAEIIKAFTEIVEFCRKCGNLTKELDVFGAVLDLIKRQKAEIKRLNKQAEEMKEGNARLYLRFNTAKNKGIKEFAERLKETPLRFNIEHITHRDKSPISKMVLFVDDNDIDILVKEMVGDTE